MSWSFSPSLLGFYHSVGNSEKPDDCFAIDDETHDRLVSEIQSGCVLSVDHRNRPITIGPAAPSMQELTASYTSALQTALDAGAKAWGYDNIFTAASYATSAVSKFRAEAELLIAWRDAVWVWAYERLAAITAGTEPLPAVPADLIAMMPVQPVQPVVEN